MSSFQAGVTTGFSVLSAGEETGGAVEDGVDTDGEAGGGEGFDGLVGLLSEWRGG
jgi:hypothetical protein